MARAGRLIYEGFWVLWDGFWIAWLSNLLWLALVIPIVTIPFAFAGLYTCTHDLVYGKSFDWKSFFIGIKIHFRSALRWGFANLLVFFALAFYMWFFSGRKGLINDVWSSIAGFLLVIALFWWIFNMFTFPFMLVQEKPSYLNALRNSVVLFLKWPGQAFGFVLFNLIVIALSFWLRFPWVVFGASLPALMACLCVKDILEQSNGVDTLSF